MSTNASILQRAQLFIGLLIVFIGLPSAMLGSYLVFQQSKNDTLKSLADRAPLVVQLIENDIAAQQRSLMHAATLLEANNVEQITEHQLDGIVQSFSGVVWAAVADQKGKVLVAYKNLLQGVDVSKRPWFVSGLEAPSVLDRHDALLLAKLLPNRPDPYRFIDIAVPIQSPKGNLLGVLALHIDWIWYQNQFPVLMGRASMDSSVSYVVFGKDDEVRLLKASAKDSALVTENSSRIDLASSLAENFYFVKQSGPEGGVLDNLDWTLYVLQNKETVNKAVLSAVFFGVVTFLVGLLASTLLFFRLTKEVSNSSVELVDALVTHDFEHLKRIRSTIPQEILPLSTKAESLISDLNIQKAALENALLDAKNSYVEINRLIAQAPIAIAMFDMKMNYIARSNLWQSSYLKHEPEPIGKSYYDLNLPISDTWRLIHQQGLAGETVSGKDDEWFDSNGKKLWLNWTVQPWTKQNGSTGGLIITTENVSGANESKIALAESEERFKLAMRGSHDGLWDWNLLTDEIYFSPSWKSMLGYLPHELEPKFDTWEQLLHPDDAEVAKRTLTTALDDVHQNQFSSTFRLAHRKGHWVPVLSRGIIVRDPNGKTTRMVGTHLDRTEIEHLQGELNEAWVMAQAEARSNESKSKFLATVSHEIRNPLNSVCGFARLIRDEVEEPELKRYAQLLTQTTDSLTLVLNDLLDFAKIDAGKLEILSEPFNLATILDELSVGGQLLCREKGIGFEYSKRWSRESSFLGDVGRIRQVVQNLLSNAIKFTHQGQVTLRVLTSEVSAHVDEITIEVHDTGIGMATDKLDKLFKPFSQLHMDSANQYGGTGLGLTIVKSLVELMQGRVVCESDTGMGSKFSVILSLKTCPSIGIVSSELIRTVAPRKILVADDSPTNLKVLAAFLSKRGHEVIQAMTGSEALNRLEEDKFDFVLLDMDMPGLSGLQVVSFVRASEGINKSTQFACVTGRVEKSVTEMALGGGFDKFFAKPLNLDDLLRYVSMDV